MSVKRELARTPRADEQEAEASVGKLLCSLVDDGLESELVEEYGKGWTSHAAANDDDFGHMRFQVTLRLSAYGSNFRRQCSRNFS